MKKLIKTIAFAGAVVATSTVSYGLDLILDSPLLTGDNTGETTFDPNTNLYVAVSTPQSMLVGETTLQYIFADSTTGDQYIKIQFTIDVATGVIDGVAGNDFEVVGALDQNGDFIPDVSGVLLAGEIVDFGYANEGTTDTYEYSIEITGGLIADSYPTGYFGLVNVSENSSFEGSFDVAFEGQGKFIGGSIEAPEEPEPEPEPEVCELEGLGADFWKDCNNYEEWRTAEVSAYSNYGYTFSVRLSCNFRLWSAIWCSGDSLSARFFRETTAALLNAKHPNITYAYTTEEVLAMVTDAFATCEYDALAVEFAAQNSLGGDLTFDPDCDTTAEEVVEENDCSTDRTSDRCDDSDRSSDRCGDSGRTSRRSGSRSGSRRSRC
ncbi:MAG: hypothetical protein ACSHYA_08965 [Opitutaceae bacterium]